MLGARSAVGQLRTRRLGAVLLVRDLVAPQEVAGLRWVREGVGGVDLPGEPLIQRGHISNNGDDNITAQRVPVRMEQLTSSQSCRSAFIIMRIILIVIKMNNSLVRFKRVSKCASLGDNLLNEEEKKSDINLDPAQRLSLQPCPRCQ